MRAVFLLLTLTACAHAPRGLEPACPSYKAGWIECAADDVCVCWRCDAARLAWERVEVCDGF